jgi:hypothetical protein
MAVCLLLGGQAGETDVPTETSTGNFDPKRAFKILQMNGRKARESGHWLKAKAAQERACASRRSVQGLSTRQSWALDNGR